MIEQRVRDELRELAEQVTVDQLRPLRTKEQRATRRPGWFRPAVAASIAAAAVVLASVVLPGLRPAVSSGSMPAYYLTVDGPPGGDLLAVVHESLHGAVTGSVTVPVRTLLSGTESATVQVAGAADDVHFVIEVTIWKAGAAGIDVILYRLTIDGAGRPGMLSELRGGSYNQSVAGVALSPDGNSLAVAFYPSRSGQGGMIGTIDLGTGRVRTLTPSPGPQSWPGVPLWTSETAFSFPIWHTTTGRDPQTALVGVEHVSARLLVRYAGITGFRTPLPGNYVNATLTASGRTLIAQSCSRDGLDNLVDQLAEFPVTAGPPRSRLLFARSVRVDHSGRTLVCTQPSADASGRHILIWAGEFGRIDDGVFTRLPDPSSGNALAVAAW